MMAPQPDINKIVETLSQQIASVAGDVTALTSAGQNRDEELKAIISAQDAMQAQITAIHTALMVAQPGQDRSLLERVARVTIMVEGVSGTGRFIGAILLFLGVLGVSVKLGVSGGK